MAYGCIFVLIFEGVGVFVFFLKGWGALLLFFRLTEIFLCTGPYTVMCGAGSS